MLDPNVVNSFFSLLTVAGQVAVAFGIALAIAYKKNPSKNPIGEFLKTYGLHFAFLTALGTTIGSLIYSEVLLYEPCKLCWYQRIFIFPQVILFGTALLKKDKKIIDYGIILSAIGLLISVYHYFIQTTEVSGLPCSASAADGGCSSQLVLEFGYISIPAMSATAFSLILLSLFYAKKS